MASTRRERLRRLWRGNLAAILRGNLMNSLLGLIAGLVLAKFLAPEGRGLLAIALAWPSIALAFLGLGLRNAAAYFAARYPDQRGEVLRASLQLALVSTVVIYALGFSASWWLVGDRPEIFQALLIGFLATPFALITGVGRGMINSLDLKLWSRVRLIQPAVYAVTIVVVAFAGSLTVVLGAVAYALSLAVSMVSVWWVIPSRDGFRASESFGGLRKALLWYGFRSSLASSAQVTNVRLDIALLGILVPATDVGLYAVASSLTQYIVPLSTAAAPWVFPRIAKADPSARSWADAQRAVRITVMIAGALALLLALAAPLLLGRFLGDQWTPALVPLWILLLGAVMQSVRFTQVSIASAFNRPELSAHSEGLAALVTVVLLWPMVQLLGVNGAAIVSVLAYSTGALLLRRGVRRAVSDVVPTMTGRRPARRG